MEQIQNRLPFHAGWRQFVHGDQIFRSQMPKNRRREELSLDLLQIKWIKDIPSTAELVERIEKINP